ncbi:nicotinate-nucleotide--dimethylbenzimidazole phosphoribosyltransferase [Aestuariirhabdus sp. Z084]|uniref:nicotinate-nucleotide--dimethylbenzimidazole phosphoribosyltransferase n=1 Tax=Aestuariirhabdus haliotis TaxID=2918751 RepID=UPI00201B3591|nr:nicotinate-nucleotide--dimethylbenzimidazole phosphoribosyltransferase [Aestuariirhabdus haliotis]MCL6414731.1 nicotinate-nucleotide--dimethylbenzimidazole phosphoribosyltransferase [Aestuariirhabdus haliotis]MCL6418663.1 nicotinate-nucleotide--dimethylbenzimidazole phosphoribosyltransferase [Aestuariirhabdus haliotis]
MDKNWFRQAAKPLDSQCHQRAFARQSQLTKPAGSLGLLETLACRLAALQASDRPQVERVAIRLFAADHGIAEQGVSAFPQEVTVQMIANFVQGGAAISVLAKDSGANLEIVDMGTCASPLAMSGVIDRSIAQGTRSFHEQAAMSEEQLFLALKAGAEQVTGADEQGCDLFIAGEMGIANTTSAAAIAACLLNSEISDMVGPGTGINEQGIEHKINIIERAVAHHRGVGVDLNDAMQVLQTFGGFEIAAMTGAYMRCAQLGIPILVDGFISTAAFLCAERLLPGTRHWGIFSHMSAEPGHQIMLQSLEAKPLLQLGMRLGEGSGAAVAIPLLKNACALHNQMATFTEAAVSDAS